MASSVCSAATFFWKSAHTGLSAPSSNGAPAMMLRVLAIDGSNTKFGEITPAAARWRSSAAISPMTRSESFSRAT